MFHPARPDDKQSLNEIKETLRDSVRVHMRSDVPVGAFLSSGIDSTSVVALAREFNPEILTFTVGFDDTDYSRGRCGAGVSPPSRGHDHPHQDQRTT